MKDTPWWFFDYMVRPVAFVLILLGVKVTLGKSDGTEKVYNAKGERWKWLTERR